MNNIPLPFVNFVDFLDGEEFLGCWHAAYLPMGADGKYVIFIPAGRRVPWKPDYYHQVLVLTNVRLRYVGEPGVLVTIPLGTVTNVALDKDSRLIDKLLTLEVTELVPQPDAGDEVVPFAGTTSVSFLMNSREGIDDMFERVSDAADAATKTVVFGHPSGEGGASGPGGPSEDAPPSSSFIRFHAENDPW